MLSGLTQRHGAFRAEADRLFAVRTGQLTSTLAQEISAAKRPPENGSSERWQLYLITKEKNEIDGLIARKTAELNSKTAVARSFDGHDPSARAVSDYLARLEQFGEALGHAHQIWESAYSASLDSRLLSAQITALEDKSSALARHHAEQTLVWREREAIWERQRQVAEQRDARIRFKQQADEDARVEQLTQANTLRLSATSSFISNPSGERIDASTERVVIAVARAGIALRSIVATLTVPQAAIFVVGMGYPSELGNGELTPEQRQRLFHAVGVPAQSLDLYDNRELQTIADDGGSVEVEYRLKPLAVPDGTAIVVVATGGEIDSRVPVVNAVLDPMTGVYTAEILGAPTRHVEFTPGAASSTPHTDPYRLAVTQPQVQDLPTGVDLRIQDCIVCVPGLPPTYLSFNVPPMGTGVVTGNGQPAAADWWKAATQAGGAAVPTQIGDQFRGREFKSFGAFDEALWRTLGENRLLASSFEALNKKRIEHGFAPYAPKNTWVGENREFELRYQERPEFWDDPFNLDQIRIKTPQSAGGWLGVVPAVVPWPIPPVSSWTPLVPPGSEHLGSTALPGVPTDPLVYPGPPAIPVLPTNETFPAVGEGEIGASIPGFPGDMELPSPGLVFVGPPVDPLEVGPYNELSGRSRGDGLDIDHIPSRKALEAFIQQTYPDFETNEIAVLLKRAPSIAIPTDVHRRYSETYGGRNTPTRQSLDAVDLRSTVNGNFDAIKEGLLALGFNEQEIETSRDALHKLHNDQGWY